MAVTLRVALVLFGLATGLAYPFDQRDDDDDDQGFDDKTCNLISFNTTKHPDFPPPTTPPEGFLSNVGLELLIRDHLLFEITTCSSAVVVLTSTADPLETPGYRLEIDQSGATLGYVYY